MLDSVTVYVLLKVAAMRDQGSWVQSQLASEILVSPSVVNRSLKKAEGLRLYLPDQKRIHGPHLEEALVHGARYFLAPQRGGEVRGTLTAWATAPLSEHISAGDPLPPVWPDPHGTARGLAVEPLHPSASPAAQADPRFYELLALADALRLGGNRERVLAAKELGLRLMPPREA